MDIIKENWNLIKENVRNEYNLSKVSFTTWIMPLKYYKEENDVVTILIPSDTSYAIDYITNKYKVFFQVTISEFTNHDYEVNFILEKDIDQFEYAEDKPDQAASPIYNVKYENAHLNSSYTFDNYIVGNNNRFAQSASLAVAESPGQAYNPLYLYGGPGLGKTHLMHSIGNFVLTNSPDKKVLYVTSEQFMNEVIESVRSGNANAMTKLRDKYRNVDVLLIDDIQFIIGKQSTQEEFFHTFNVLHEAGKQIVITSDKPPKEIDGLDERFKSRFLSGLSADIGAPDYETRVAILKGKAEKKYMDIDDDIIGYIAENITNNIRELEGSLNKVMAYSNIKKEEITLDLVKDALKDIITPEENAEITPKYIAKVVADHFSINVDDICSKKRNAEFVLPRHIAMYISRNMTGFSLKKISLDLGQKDHTTVINAVDKIEEMIKAGNKDIITKVEAIHKKLKPM